MTALSESSERAPRCLRDTPGQLLHCRAWLPPARRHPWHEPGGAWGLGRAVLGWLGRAQRVSGWLLAPASLVRKQKRAWAQPGKSKSSFNAHSTARWLLTSEHLGSLVSCLCCHNRKGSRQNL